MDGETALHTELRLEAAAGASAAPSASLHPLLKSIWGEQSFSRHKLFSALNRGIKPVADSVLSALPVPPDWGCFTVSGHAKSCIICRQDSQECGSAAEEQLEDTLK